MEYKSLGIVYNPISGNGRAKLNAQKIEQSLKLNFEKIELLESQRIYNRVEIRSWLRGKDIVFIVGGDGTFLGLIPYLSARACPVYVFPSGNESLAAKLFGARRNVDSFIAGLEGGEIRRHYYANICLENEQKPFFTMLSLGLDSQAVKLIGERTGTSSNVMYIKAGFKAFVAYVPPRISLWCEGEKVIDRQSGYLIIAKNPMFARNFQLVPESDSAQAQLWARFFPGAGRIAEIEKGLRMMFARPANLRASKLFSAKEFRLSVENGPYAIQADGEYFGDVSDVGVNLNVAEEALLVLTQT